MDMMKVFLRQSGLPKDKWHHARLAACYTMDRIPRKHGQTPYELYYLQKPDLFHMRVFGSSCYYHVHSLDRQDKFSTSANHGMFLGYDEHRRAYKVLPQGCRLPVYSRSVIFDERGVIQRALQTHSEEIESSDIDDQSHAVFQQRSMTSSHTAQPIPSVDKRTVLQSAKLGSPSPSKSVHFQVPVKSPVIALKDQPRANAKSDLQSRPRTRRTLKLLAQDSEESVSVTLECPSSFTTFPVQSSLFPDDYPEFAFSMEEMV